MTPTAATPLDVTCVTDENTGRLSRKIEQPQCRLSVPQDDFIYAFDEAGHLTRVSVRAFKL